MGCAGSKDEETSAIDATLKAEQAAQASEIKLLLLGTGESGKSTTARQLQIIYLKKLNEQMALMGTLLQQNIVHGMQILIKGATNIFELDLEPQNRERAESFLALPENTQITQELVSDVKALWEDATIKSTFQRAYKLQLPYAMKFLMANLDRIAAPDFHPTNEDVLMARARTTGIIETTFEADGTKFRIMDVGGQRNERRKWINCFDNVTAIIFCVALNEFNEKLFEDESVNRMNESMAMFQDIANNPTLTNTSILIFFNKSDLFRQKLAEGHDLKELFPDYTGGPNFDAAVNYIEEQYVSLCKIPYKTLYSYVTCATDTNSIKAVFEVTSRILKKRQQETASAASSSRRG